MSPAEVLRKAAEVIRERGWNQGDYEGRNGAVCMYGAIRVASGLSCLGEDPDPPEPAAFLEAAIGLPKKWGAGSDWNDAVGRTAEEVIAALEKAAELAESK